MKRYTTRPSLVWAIRYDATREAAQEVAAFMAQGGGRAYRREGQMYLLIPGGGEVHLGVGDYLLAQPDPASLSAAVRVVAAGDFEATYQEQV